MVVSEGAAAVAVDACEVLCNRLRSSRLRGPPRLADDRVDVHRLLVSIKSGEATVTDLERINSDVIYTAVLELLSVDLAPFAKVKDAKEFENSKIYFPVHESRLFGCVLTLAEVIVEKFPKAAKATLPIDLGKAFGGPEHEQKPFLIPLLIREYPVLFNNDFIDFSVKSGDTYAKP